VVDLSPRGAAEKAGMWIGAQILKINDRDISTLENAAAALVDGQDEDSKVTQFVIRTVNGGVLPCVFLSALSLRFVVCFVFLLVVDAYVLTRTATNVFSFIFLFFFSLLSLSDQLHWFSSEWSRFISLVRSGLALTWSLAVL
jgi:hypothetical protein